MPFPKTRIIEISDQLWEGNGPQPPRIVLGSVARLLGDDQLKTALCFPIEGQGATTWHVQATTDGGLYLTVEAVRQSSGWSYDSSADEDRTANAVVTASLRSLRDLVALRLRDPQVWTPPDHRPDSDWECVGTWELCWRDGTTQILELGKYPGQERETKAAALLVRFREVISGTSA